MQLETSRFGEIQYQSDELICFSEGLLGFEHLKSYLLIPFEGNPAFSWLQAAQDGNIAFLLIDPFLFFPDYELELEDELKEKLQIFKREQVAIYTICTIPGSDIKKITTNLIGPLVINMENFQGAQYVLNDFKYHTKHPLFKETRKTEAT